MQKNMYTIYDKIAKETGPIVTYNNDHAALRALPGAFKGHEESINEFDLYCVGSIDINTMEVFACEPRRIDYIDKRNEE